MRANDRRAWIVVVLLFIFVMINFADKAVIGIAAVPIMQELELGPRQFGLLGSSFFLLFAVSSVATGFLVDRVQTRWVLLAMGFIWALTQFPMMGSVGFETLVACRIALGAGEGPATPVALHSAYKWFPNELRTLPTAVIVQGGAIGVMVALPLLNWVIVRWTWHCLRRNTCPTIRLQRGEHLPLRSSWNVWRALLHENYIGDVTGLHKVGNLG
jgi:MFS transporter, ACS family, D-galactonate transporter